MKYDNLVETTLVDESQEVPTVESAVIGLSYLAPFFSGRGIDNVIKAYNGIGAFERDFGKDLADVEKYGSHAGFMATEILASRGSRIHGCRLMPEDATRATIMLGVTIRAGEVMTPQYERDNYNNYTLTEAGEKIPKLDGGSNPIELAGKTVKVETAAYDPMQTETVNFLPKTTSYDVSVAQDGSEMEDWTFYPLFALYAKGRGKYGTDIGFNLQLDAERDGDNEDGRRYVMELYETNAKGVNVRLGSSREGISFSFDPEAVVIPGTKITDTYINNFAAYNKDTPVPVGTVYSAVNYNKVKTVLAPYFDGDVDLLDLISFKDLGGNDYDRIVRGVTSLDTAEMTTYLENGVDGSLDAEWLIANDAEVTNEEEAKLKIAATQSALLIQFFDGQIDRNLFDARVIPVGIALDAWYPWDVKEFLVGLFHNTVRPDVFLYMDLGEANRGPDESEALGMALANKVSSENGNICINAHNGTTTNRVSPVRTSGNYEIASKLTEMYNIYGPATILAGYEAGKVENMIFDFYPANVRGQVEIKPLENLNLLFAMRLDEKEDLYFVSDAAQYKSKYSVLGSCANQIFAGSVMRAASTVLARHSFSPNGAESAIEKATNELNDVYTGGKFESANEIDFRIVQTRNDKINNSARVEIFISFGDVIRNWKVTVHARRKENA